MAPDTPAELLQLTYRADLDLLVGRWTHEPDPALLPAAYQQLARAAEASNCRYWLQDIRRRVVNDPAITRWLLTEFMPNMARRLGGVRVAYLTSPALLAHIMAAPEFKSVEHYAGKPYQVNFFGDEGAAVAWLFGV
ncbi:hypothetical protein [Hymenobacter psychrophilus]|uniref:SpoIIAA-like n=1 Tax=Hymenobacter psychrophilus TaxID=651662 RepID=A0A1H3I3F1_9BACT|nr:hypothetical protein [Hymenobacter psychrophilus]SDY21628.1 hypothetical protein SAMN04488069_106247 [Hymenobacter psychrophilus]